MPAFFRQHSRDFVGIIYRSCVEFTLGYGSYIYIYKDHLSMRARVWNNGKFREWYFHSRVDMGNQSR